MILDGRSQVKIKKEAHLDFLTRIFLDNCITAGILVFQDVSLAAKESSAAQLQAMKLRYEEAVELRRKAESDIEAFRPVGAIQTSSIHIIKIVYSTNFV